MAGNVVPKLYKSVVEDVISNVKESFLDEGVDEQVLVELKQLWETKLQASKAVDGLSSEQDPLIAQYQQHASNVQQQRLKQQQQQGIKAAALSTTSNTQIPHHIVYSTDLSSAAQTATAALPMSLYSQQLAALQGGTITLQTADGSSTQVIVQAPQQLLQQTGQTLPQGATYTMAAPQQLVVTNPSDNSATTQSRVLQLDGANDSSSDDDDDGDGDDDDDDDDEQNEENEDAEGEEEEPLHSGDDVSEDDPAEIFDTDNVVVCQFDKINRCKNKWKFHLKDGIMNLNGKDYVFQKGTGDAEW